MCGNQMNWGLMALEFAFCDKTMECFVYINELDWLSMSSDRLDAIKVLKCIQA